MCTCSSTGYTSSMLLVCASKVPPASQLSQAQPVVLSMGRRKKNPLQQSLVELDPAMFGHTVTTLYTHTHALYILLYNSPCERMTCRKSTHISVDEITNYHSVHRNNLAIEPCCYSNGYWCACAVTSSLLMLRGAHRLVFNQNYLNQPLYHIGSIASVNQPLFRYCMSTPSLDNFKAPSLFTTVSEATTDFQ